ncbi:MAG: sigma-70 family RNA polymerase sigma factor [Verrucomicrobiae bacterium]|nr:sigma-70 family RNA polymerase sigma factor [Verrucomicrobiae bacterium]
MSDGELLRAYALEGSEAAFTELVNRYVSLVHSVARRHLTDPSLAEEVTQSAFVLLARKAGSLAGHPSLAGWLHRTAWQLAARTARTEQRRRHWEAVAGAIVSEDPPMPDPDPSPIVPALDEALQELAEPDRDAIVLRYFLRKPLRDVGAALGTSDAAAKMRIHRALDQLRRLLIQRGITCSPAALAAAMTGQGVALAPAALAARVASAATGAGGAVTSLPLLIHGLLGLMNGTKLTVILLAAALVAVLSTVVMRSGPTQSAPDGATDPSLATVEPPESPPVPAASRLLPMARVAAQLTPSELEAARQRLRKALAAPSKGGTIWPDSSGLEAMAAFGGRHDELFATLREVFLEPDSTEDAEGGRRLARMRAINAMGELNKNVPGLTSFLWETAWRSDWSGRVGAFSALRKLGLESSDLPALTELLRETAKVDGSPAMRRFLPDAIHEVFRQNPEATSQHLPGLVKLFEETADPVTRFSAATVLLGTPHGTDPRVIESIRDGLREGLNVSIADHRGVNVDVAIEHAAAAGEAAKPLIPDLLEVARTSHESYQQDAAWLAIGQIQPELRAQIPELDQAMTRDAETRQARQDVSQGFATHDDLIRALGDPATALQAATTLGRTGIQSPEAIPAMIAALAGMDEDSRDQVVQAIHQLDPQAPIERVPADVMFHGVIFADSTFDSRPGSEKDPRVERLISDQRMHHTWRTREEILNVTRKLAALDVQIAQAFANGIAEKDPVLADQARQLIASPARP